MEIIKIGLPVNLKLKEDTFLPDKSQEAGFGAILAEALGKTNASLKNAENMTRDFALGKDVELHQVVLATERATLALQLTVQVRNKVIEAYQEIMRMQV